MSNGSEELEKRGEGGPQPTSGWALRQPLLCKRQAAGGSEPASAGCPFRSAGLQSGASRFGRALGEALRHAQGSAHAGANGGTLPQVHAGSTTIASGFQPDATRTRNVLKHFPQGVFGRLIPGYTAAQHSGNIQGRGDGAWCAAWQRKEPQGNCPEALS